MMAEPSTIPSKQGDQKRHSFSLFSLLALALFLAISFAAAGVSIFFPAGSEGWQWYRALEKPPGMPPDSAFGPVWTVLYTLIGIAAWRVWRAASFHRTRLAWGAFVVQWVLNASWTPLFFGFQQPGWALIIIVALLGAIGITAVCFRRHDRWAGWLLAPYLVWVSYATYLNLMLWALNKNVAV